MKLVPRHTWRETNPEVGMAETHSCAWTIFQMVKRSHLSTSLHNPRSCSSRTGWLQLPRVLKRSSGWLWPSAQAKSALSPTLTLTQESWSGEAWTPVWLHQGMACVVELLSPDKHYSILTSHLSQHVCSRLHHHWREFCPAYQTDDLVDYWQPAANVAGLLTRSDKLLANAFLLCFSYWVNWTEELDYSSCYFIWPCQKMLDILCISTISTIYAKNIHLDILLINYSLLRCCILDICRLSVREI